MVNPIRYVGLWNWRTKNWQIRQNSNSPAKGWRDRFRHGDVSVATDERTFGQRLGGWVIHFPAVVRTSSPSMTVRLVGRGASGAVVARKPPKRRRDHGATPQCPSQRSSSQAHQLRQRHNRVAVHACIRTHTASQRTPSQRFAGGPIPAASNDAMRWSTSAPVRCNG
jgi:hypothetical protein